MISENKKPIERKKFNKKWKNFRKKSCYFTRQGITYIDYKNVDLLKKFISPSGIILPRKVTGTKARYQKHLAKAIKRARFLALLSYVSNSTN